MIRGAFRLLCSELGSVRKLLRVLGSAIVAVYNAHCPGTKDHRNFGTGLCRSKILYLIGPFVLTQILLENSVSIRFLRAPFTYSRCK